MFHPRSSGAEAAPGPGAWPFGERLDALTAGAYDTDVLLREACLLAKAAPDGVCEMLSVIDQFFRLGKIRVADYQQLKSHLGVLVVSGARELHGARAQPERRTFVQPVEPIEVTEPVAGSGTPSAADQAPVCAVGAEAMEARCPVVGDTLRGRYRVTAIIGRGGSGTVFEVVDQYLADAATNPPRLALKVLNSEVTRRPAVLRALLAEFLTLRSLTHPNIVRVHDFDRDDQMGFFTMELLCGSSSAVMVGAHGGALARAHARSIVQDVGMALAHAHSRAIVHGDINPQNIFLTDDGEVRLLDFGSSNPAPSSPLGVPVATLRYASCEILEGRPAGPADDVFALACVAYVLLSGRHPFANRTALQARAEQLRPPRPRGLRRRHWMALRSALDLRGDRRPTDVDRWVQRFNAGVALAPLPRLSELLSAPADRRRGKLAALIVSLLLAVAAGSLWAGHPQRPLQRLAALLHGRTANTPGEPSSGWHGISLSPPRR